MEQFIRQQTIAIFRRLLSTMSDNDEVRRRQLLELLADEEANKVNSWERGAQETIRAIRQRSGS